MKIMLIGRTVHSHLQIKHLIDVGKLDQQNLRCNDLEKFENMIQLLTESKIDPKHHYFLTLFIKDIPDHIVDKIINTNENLNINYRVIDDIILSGNITQFERTAKQLKDTLFGQELAQYLKSNFGSFKEGI